MPKACPYVMMRRYGGRLEWRCVAGGLKEVHVWSRWGELRLWRAGLLQWCGTAFVAIDFRFVGFGACAESFIPVLESGILAHKSHRHIAHRTTTVLGDDKFSLATNVFALGINSRLGVVFGTVNEANDVGILLNRTRFTKVAQLRTLAVLVIATRFHITVELRQGDDWNV